MATEYDIGDTVRMSGSFLSTASTAIDPTTVTLWVKAPSSTVTVVSGTGLTAPTSGTYQYDMVVGTSGVWNYRMYSTGTVVTSEDYWFTVKQPLVASTGT